MLGGAVVLATVQSVVTATVIPMVALHGCWVTAEHPVLSNGEWVLPSSIGAVVWRNPGSVYNLILDTDHTVLVNEMLYCTLAHNSDLPGLAHPWWGTDRCLRALRDRPDWPRCKIDGGEVQAQSSSCGLDSRTSIGSSVQVAAFTQLECI